MFYDYSGFPEEAYSIRYPAHGSPELAKRISEVLSKNNITTRLNPKRGFDHGLFIPLKLMYPAADIDSLQLSLIRGLDPTMHIALGKALRELMHENILVIGSGFSFHSMCAMVWQEGRRSWCLTIASWPSVPWHFYGEELEAFWLDAPAR